MRHTPAQPERVYRNAPVAGFRGAILLLAGAFFLGVLVLYCTHLPAGSDGFSEAALASLLGPAAAVLAASGITTVRSAIITGPGGVTVRSATGRRTHVPWPDVTGFQLIPARRYTPRLMLPVTAVAVIRAAPGAPGTAGPGGRHRHASHPPLYCPGTSFWRPSSRAHQMIQYLQADRRVWLSQHHRQTPGTGPVRRPPG